MKYFSIFFFILFTFLFLNQAAFSQPNPPTDFIATQIIINNHPAVKLEWQGSNSMERYKIFKRIGGINDTTSFFQIASNLMHRSFADHMILPDEIYSYFVKAFNAQGISDPSDTVEITITGLPEPAVVTGIVLNDVEDTPVVGAKVHLINSNAMSGNFTSVTNNLGEFRIVVPPATYLMRTAAMSYIPEFYDNVLTIQEATPIVLSPGDSLGFNIGLAPIIPPVLYTLSGHVEDETGNPLKARIHILPVKTNTFFMPHVKRATVTDSLGNYSIQVREDDTIVVYCKPFNFNLVPEFWDNKNTFAEADRIPVSGNITGIDFVISPVPFFNNGISGLVKNQGNEGVEAHITAFNMSVNHHRKITIATDSLGNYAFTNMKPGQYILLAFPEIGYTPTFFQYNGNQTLNWREADSVEVTETSLITGIDFTVLPISVEGFATVNGNVKDNTGTAVCGAMVFAVDDKLNVYSYAITDANGNYVIEGFIPGDYRIICDKLGYTTNTDQWVNLDYSSNISASAFFTLIPEGATSAEGENIIENYHLYQNFPSPFNPGTVISWQLPVNSYVTLKVFDVLGNEIAVLVNEEKTAGTFSVNFNTSSIRGGLASGIYFYTLKAGEFYQTKKMILTK